MIFWYGSSVLSLSLDGRLSSVCSDVGLPPSLVEQFRASSAAATAQLAAVTTSASCFAVVLELDDAMIEAAMVENARCRNAARLPGQMARASCWLDGAHPILPSFAQVSTGWLLG